jgi:hypothetical protein
VAGQVRANHDTAQEELFDSSPLVVHRRCQVCGCALSKTYPFTYLVQRQGWIKIGGTNNPRRRINELSRWDWQQYVLWPEGMNWRLPVVPLLVVELEIEHPLHLQFADYHVIGEWFSESEVISNWIARQRT